MSSLAEQHEAGWYARLQLGFQRRPGRTVLAERTRQGPLAVQRSFYPEGDLCHVYLLHPPGGVAGGDQLNINIHVAEQAAALITTPGATKFYRSVGPMARQQQQITVEGGCLEWLPQENIIFPGARAELATRVDLHGDARFIGWEINCLGRPVVDEQFNHGSASFACHLFRDGLPLLHERQLIDTEQALAAAAGLRNQPVLGTLYATLAERSLLEKLRATIPLRDQHAIGLTLVDDLFIARYLGDSTETARRLFIEIWKILRPVVVNRPPSEPRIWNT
ncbi:urease accessory protein UreD [Sedimenticola thiotaurini]|nr:urease accessory protein UreD [Sedimenticola thiotaurini]